MARNGQMHDALERIASLESEQLDVLSYLCREELAGIERPSELPTCDDQIEDSALRFYVIIEGTRAVLASAGKHCQ